MAYVPFVVDKPVISDDGATVIQNTRENLMALRDAIVAGALVSWNMAVTPPYMSPPTIVWSKGVERIRATLTWGTTGGSTSNPTVIVYAYSNNSGSSYDTIGTATFAYLSDGGLISVTWS